MTYSRDVPLCPVLIGRADLLALADRRLATAREGQGHLLLLAGEAGVGKTRLLSAVRAMAAGQGFTVVGAATYPRDVEVPGGVLADLAANLRPLVADLADRFRVDRLPDGDAYRQRRLLVGALAESVAELGAALGPVLL